MEISSFGASLAFHIDYGFFPGALGTIADVGGADPAVFSHRVQEVLMSIVRQHAVGFATAVVLIMPLAGSVLAQDADEVRGKCITEVMRAYPNTNAEGPDSRARVELYITCMRQHGLQP